MNRGAPGQLPALNDWWQLPSGRVVSVRRIEGADGAAEVTVRYVDEEGALAQGEFHLSLSFISRGRLVGHDTSI